jgi:hypothetical protein
MQTNDKSNNKKSDWNEFCAAWGNSWFELNQHLFDVAAPASPLDGAFKPTSEFEKRFPLLTKLFNQARATHIVTKPGKLTTHWGQVYDGHMPPEFYLLRWEDKAEQSTFWVVPPPGVPKDDADRLVADHQMLLRSFGGIRNQWQDWATDEGANLLMNANGAFCEPYINIPLGWNQYYTLLEEEERFENNVFDDNYVVFAVDANGNRSAYHKDDGTVLLYATDHNFNHVTQLSGYPEYTLYTINGCPTFQSWVERVAEQWLQRDPKAAATRT